MAWPRRPEDELKLAEALGNVKALGVIHDRRVPGSKEYPDHIAVDLLSRFVIDAKRYQGTIRLREVGGRGRARPR